MGERSADRVSVGKPDIKDHFEDSNIHGRIILKFIFKKWNSGQGLDWSGSE